jgi:hypothetical protein
MYPNSVPVASVSQLASASAPIGCQIFSEKKLAIGRPIAARSARDRT